jgi:signal transduction histidine kinase/CheY-like chemotaxis protein
VGNNVLFRWIPSGGEWQEFVGLSAPQVVDGESRMWFTARQSVLQLTGESEWESLPYTARTITLDHDREVVILSVDEVIRFKSNRVIRYGPDQTGIYGIHGHMFDVHGALWIHGTDANGHNAVSVLDGGSWIAQAPVEIQAGGVYGGGPHTAGGVWYLVFEEPLGRSRVFHVTQSEVSEIRVPDATTWNPPALHVDYGGSLWLCGDLGLFVLRDSGWQDIEGIPGRHVAEAVNGDRETWFVYTGVSGGRTGLGRIREGTWSYFELERLHSVGGPGTDGTVFFAGAGVLYASDSKNGGMPVQLAMPAQGRIHSAVRGPNGDLWIGVDDSVFRYRADGVPPQTLVAQTTDEVAEGEPLPVTFQAVERFKRDGTGTFAYSWRIDSGAWTDFGPAPTGKLPIAVGNGRHSLEVRARDEGLDIDPTPARIEFSVRAVPLIYRWWFWTVTGVLFVASAILAGAALVARRRARFHAINLERMVSERTAALECANRALQAEIGERRRATEELERARTAAEAASRAKSVLLANLSHEIRTPIMALLGATEMYRGRLDGKPLESKLADMLFRNARHLQTMFDDLLDAARQETGNFSMSLVEYSLIEILADVRCVAEALPQSEKVEFAITFDSPLPSRIHTDPARLKQAILNLVSNALKFTTRGHVYVRVKVDRDADEPRLAVAVEDTGPGIPRSEFKRIFDMFEQVEPKIGETHCGVGLGLPLTRYIVEQLGGAVAVESREGQGSTFTLRVATGPLHDATWIAPTELAASWRPSATGPVPSAQQRIEGSILIAEDFSDARELIANALSNAGAAVTAVENGRDAVKAAKGKSFDLVLLDIRMPVMDGTEAASELRRQRCLMPIIALTASAGEQDRQKFLASGFDEVWAKPISLNGIVGRAAAYLRSSSAETVTVPASKLASTPTTDTNARFKSAMAEFARDLPARFRIIQTAVRDGDLKTAREALHQLAGAGGIMGYMPVSEEAGRVLHQIKCGAFCGREEGLRQLESVVTEIAQSVSASP